MYTCAFAGAPRTLLQIRGDLFRSRPPKIFMRARMYSILFHDTRCFGESFPRCFVHLPTWSLTLLLFFPSPLLSSRHPPCLPHALNASPSLCTLSLSVILSFSRSLCLSRLYDGVCLCIHVYVYSMRMCMCVMLFSPDCSFTT